VGMFPHFQMAYFLPLARTGKTGALAVIRTFDYSERHRTTSGPTQLCIGKGFGNKSDASLLRIAHEVSGPKDLMEFIGRGMSFATPVS
jgi:hypothetical protein